MIRKMLVIIAGAILLFSLGTNTAQANPRPEIGDGATMAKAWHCGQYFHGHTVRGFLIRRAIFIPPAHLTFIYQHVAIVPTPLSAFPRRPLFPVCQL